MARKRTSEAEQILNLLLDFVQVSWKVGAGLTGALVFLAAAALMWALQVSSEPPPAPTDPAAIALPYVHLALYLVPLGLLAIAAVFGIKTARVYERERSF